MEFVKVLNLRSVDVLTVKLWFDRKVGETIRNQFPLNEVQEKYHYTHLKDDRALLLQC